MIIKEVYMTVLECPRMISSHISRREADLASILLVLHLEELKRRKTPGHLRIFLKNLRNSSRWMLSVQARWTTVLEVS